MLLGEIRDPGDFFDELGFGHVQGSAIRDQGSGIPDPGPLLVVLEVLA
jgi:hypothetical protein